MSANKTNNSTSTEIVADDAVITAMFEQLGLDETEIAAEPNVEKIEVPQTEDEISLDLDDDSIDLDLALDEEPQIETPPPKKQKQKRTAKSAPAPEDSAAANEAKTNDNEVKSSQQRVTHYNSKKSEVLLDRLGGSKDMILLEASDIELDSEKLKAKQEHLLSILNNQPTVLGTRGNGETVQKKVAEKVIILFSYFKNGGSLNKVMRIAFETIIKDGYISTGKNGNLFTNLMAAHYSEGTARAQSGQMLQMFPLLKIATKEGNKLIPNEQSLILAKLKAELDSGI